MADKYFDNWAALEAATKRASKRILQRDVSPVAEEILRSHIETDIYGVYRPKPNAWVNGTTYQRRHVLPAAVTSIFEGDDTLVVTSTAAPSRPVRPGASFSHSEPGAFLKLLQSGHMGIWRGGFARPAVRNTQQEVDGSPRIKQAILQGIKREIGNCNMT